MDVTSVAGVDVDNNAGLATSTAGGVGGIVVNHAAGLSSRVSVIGDVVTRDGALMAQPVCRHEH